MLKLHHNHLFLHSHPGLMKCSLIKPSKHIQAEENITALVLNTCFWVFYAVIFAWGGVGKGGGDCYLHHNVST